MPYVPETAVGSLIKKCRLSQNMSQENLSKGICAVSYLSKIEAGLVSASEEIIAQLFQALHIQYCIDTDFISEAGTIIDDYLKCYYFGYTNECNRLYDLLKPKESIYLFSPLMLDYQLVKCHALSSSDPQVALEILEELHYFDKYLSPLQHYYLLHIQSIIHIHSTKSYSQALDAIQKARSYNTSCTSYLTLAECYFHLGRYTDAIDTNELGFKYTIEEGNMLCALNICLLQARTYSSLKNTHLMLKYYNRALNLSEGLGDLKYKQQIYYELGLTFLVLKDFSEALSYLLKSLALAQMNHSDSPTLSYLLAMIHLEIKDAEGAKNYLNLAYTNLSPHTLPILNQMLDLASLRLRNAAYMFDTNYLNLLETLYIHIDSTLPFAFKQFHGDYLIECYKVNRRYKDALRITEELYVHSLSFPQ